MTQKRIVSLSVVAALGLLSPLNAYAFGLGQISVNSALNQPFEAEIPVTSLRATERGNLDVRLASLSDFDRAGLERSLLLTQLRFEVIEQGESALVKITSQVPIKEPFLDFLITASAGEGRMLREYTVLLDPPSEVFNRTRPQPAAVTPQPSSRPSASAVSRPSTPADRYQVRKGDTLWQIAQQTRPSGDITAQQMMMALLAANPDAFQRNNINGLRSDVTLQIPDAATIRQLSPAEANAGVNEQSAQWQNRSQPAANPVEVASETAEAPAQSTPPDASNEDANAETDALVEQPSAEQRAEETSRLQLVAAADDGDAEADPAQLGDPDVQELNEQLTLAQETIEAQNQENIDFKARMDAMEEQLETMRRLLSLKDEDMARLQSILEEESEIATDSQPLVAINTDETAPEADVANDTAVVNDDISDVTVDESADKPAAANYLDAAKSFVSHFLMEILLGFLLFLLLVWLVVRHRRQEQTWDEAVGTDSYDDSDRQADLDDADSNNMVAPEVSEFVSAPEQPEKTVDELVEQADMFVGYADYVQARTALEQAHQLAPEDKAVAAKLLFVLFKQNKATEFNSVLAASDINETDSQWSDVSGWGLAIMPNDARFKAQPTEIASVSDDFTEVLDQPAPTSEPTTEDIDISDSQAKSDAAIEFDLTQYQTDDNALDETTGVPLTAETDDATAVEFDNSRSHQLDEKISEDDLTPIHLDLDDNDSDFADWQADSQQSEDDGAPHTISLDIDEVDAESEVDKEAEKIAMQALDVDDVQDDLDFDLSGFDEVDEAETKLDLAAAYVDMGDPDGARGILQEVLNEGTDEQKQRAQVLLDSLT